MKNYVFTDLKLVLPSYEGVLACIFIMPAFPLHFNGPRVLSGIMGLILLKSMG